jgi:hypothetical protein
LLLPLEGSDWPFNGANVTKVSWLAF